MLVMKVMVVVMKVASRFRGRHSTLLTLAQ